jgi:hypothetical protein
MAAKSALDRPCIVGAIDATHAIHFLSAAVSAGFLLEHLVAPWSEGFIIRPNSNRKIDVTDLSNCQFQMD